MSSFIVENKTINEVVTAISKDIYLSDEVKQTFNICLETMEGKNQLGNKIYALNISGVSQRYGTADDMIGSPYKFESIYPVSNIQVYKSLRCLLYQCSEGDNEESRLFKFLDNEVCKGLAHNVISNMPEYDEARWG